MAETEYIIYLFLEDDHKPKQTIKLKRSLAIRHCCILLTGNYNSGRNIKTFKKYKALVVLLELSESYVYISLFETV